MKDEQSQETLKRIIEAGFYRKDEPSLGSRVAKELFLDPKRVSVTRLERFASCAYAHFLNYGLRLLEREKYGFEAMDLGNIAHQAL
ncbi:PD-(D/E)XK nuclease family protein, partial [Escherichia coli]|nr:PD-(D/E)XK nuclease family protein [Escherichia coli]